LASIAIIVSVERACILDCAADTPIFGVSFPTINYITFYCAIVPGNELNSGAVIRSPSQRFQVAVPVFDEDDSREVFASLSFEVLGPLLNSSLIFSQPQERLLPDCVRHVLCRADGRRQNYAPVIRRWGGQGLVVDSLACATILIIAETTELITVSSIVAGIAKVIFASQNS